MCTALSHVLIPAYPQPLKAEVTTPLLAGEGAKVPGGEAAPMVRLAGAESCPWGCPMPRWPLHPGPAVAIPGLA